MWWPSTLATKRTWSWWWECFVIRAKAFSSKRFMCSKSLWPIQTRLSQSCKFWSRTRRSWFHFWTTSTMTKVDWFCLRCLLSFSVLMLFFFGYRWGAIQWWKGLPFEANSKSSWCLISLFLFFFPLWLRWMYIFISSYPCKLIINEWPCHSAFLLVGENNITFILLITFESQQSQLPCSSQSISSPSSGCSRLLLEGNQGLRLLCSEEWCSCDP